MPADLVRELKSGITVTLRTVPGDLCPFSLWERIRVRRCVLGSMGSFLLPVKENEACRLLPNVSPLLRCSLPWQRCCRSLLPQRVTRHRASGAMGRRCGPLVTKHAAPAAAMSLRDTMEPVRDTARMLQRTDAILQGALRARSRRGDSQIR